MEHGGRAREDRALQGIRQGLRRVRAAPILETFLPDSKRFRKETAAERKAVFRSTAFPADKALVRGSNLDKLVDEILGIIKN